MTTQTVKEVRVRRRRYTVRNPRTTMRLDSDGLVHVRTACGHSFSVRVHELRNAVLSLHWPEMGVY